MSGNLLRAAAMAASLASLGVAAPPAHAAADEFGVPSLEWHYDHPYDVTLFGHVLFTYYGSYDLVTDPMATNETGFTLSIRYNPVLFAFDPAGSGPLGVFSVGGDAPTPHPGVGTQPAQVLPSTGYNPGAPLPGSTLTYTNSGGLLTVSYQWGTPISVSADVDDFFLDFTVLHPGPVDLAASTVTYSAASPGTTFTQTSSSCTTTPVGGPCGSDTPAEGVSVNTVFLPVPEPAGWAVFIVGVALVGAAARHRRAAVA